MSWLAEYFIKGDSLSRPDWDRIFEHVDRECSPSDQDQFWTDVARRWLDILIAELPNGYSYVETENFILLSKTNDRYVELFQIFLERCLKRLLSIMKGIANDEGDGKYIVMIFDDLDTYYAYTDNYEPQEGTYGLSAGMYLNYGYGHFVFPHQQLDYAEPIAAHEMTHALLCHLPIPHWLNEGMAVNMEAMITGMEPPRLDKEAYERHVRFWGVKEIQEFWRGSSFTRPDEGQQLSYQLAQILVTNLSENYEAFVEFANKADWSDAGESAANQVYDISLGNLIENFLGEGSWYPNPKVW